jgi:hypothetical protein
MSAERLLKDAPHQVKSGASRVMIRFAELMSNSPETISTIARLQRNLRDTDRKALGQAMVLHSQEDGGIYFDITLGLSDKEAALRFAVESTSNAVCKAMVPLRHISEAHVIDEQLDWDTPYAWTYARKNPSTSQTEAARIIMAEYQDGLFPAIDLGPSVEALYF